jgi:diguanylate cyclase (GGDEF)-like protein
MKLDERVAEGDKLVLTKIDSINELNHAQSRFRIWNDYNEALLARLFSDETLVTQYVEYRGAGVTRHHQAIAQYELARRVALFRSDVDDKVTRLRSVVERLDLYAGLPISASDGVQTPDARIWNEPARVAVHYFIQEHFETAFLHWMAPGQKVGGSEQAMLERALRVRLKCLKLAPGFDIEEILKEFVLSVASPEELFAVLEEMPRVRQEYVGQTSSRTGEASILGTAKLRQEIEKLLRELGVDATFAPDGTLSRTMVDTTTRRLRELSNNKEEAQGFLAAALRTEASVGVLLMDLDGFKALNDRAGHPAGDRCLEVFVTIVAAIIKGKGKLFRYGGDEFLVVLPNFDGDEASSTGVRIARAIPEGGVDATGVTVSIGVAVGVHPDATMDVIKRADDAMYAVKNTRKGKVITWPLDEETARIVATARETAVGR